MGESSKKNLIRFDDLCLSYGTREILKNIYLDVYEGETLAIIGPSGSGKSTLLKLAIGLQKPTSGRVLIGEKDVGSLSYSELNQLRTEMGMVFQYSALFDSMNVGENVAFSLLAHQKEMPLERVREVVNEKLSIVGLEGYEHYMPAELSGGMKKRVGLARAIAPNPPILLYDEPTSGLDPVISRQIDDLIVKTQTQLGVTSIVVTHDMVGVFRIADRIAMLHEGQIIEVGTPEEFVRSPRSEVQQFIEYGLGRAEKGGG